MRTLTYILKLVLKIVTCKWERVLFLLIVEEERGDPDASYQKFPPPFFNWRFRFNVMPRPAWSLRSAAHTWP